MKQRIFQFTMLLAAALSVSRCGEDSEKPKTIPEVTTTAVTEFTTTSATVGGEITNDGNSEVTVTGIVYSSIVGVPTIADDKIELTDTEGDFSTLLEDLTSSTLYHVRAFATNSKGTGYGDVVDFTTGNAPPIATNVSVTGPVEVNGLLTATYTYTDSEGDAQATSTFQWYFADNATGTGEAAIAGAITLTYTVQAAQQGKFIRFGVTPKAGAGNMNGVEVKSAFVGAVGEATTVTFTYNGSSVTYGILNSSATGKKWLDRNLGAPGVASSETDYANFGDLFQWGRAADGHQLITRNGPGNSDMTGGGVVPFQFPNVFATSDSPGNALFILDYSGENGGDWRNPHNDNLWQGVNGTNNPCPVGWRIATKDEWAAENISNMADGFTKLKLTLTGVRTLNDDGDGAAFFQSTSFGNYWTSTKDVSTGETAYNYRVWLGASSNTISGQARISGMACRCIKN